MLRAMGGRTGSSVALDVESGALLAAHRPDSAARRVARPGSTLKPFVLLALLESGRLPPDAQFMCPMRLSIAGRRLDCSHLRPAGPFAAAEALALSCNCFFAMQALRLSDEELVRAIEQSGVTARSGLLREEASGFVRRSASAERRQLKALGEADLGVTPLGLASAYRRLALRIRSGEQSAALDAVRLGLETAVSAGLAQSASTPGLSVAGKTGTATAEGSVWRHGWFAGFAPAERPELIVVVFLENGTGPLDAAPAASVVFAAFAEARSRAEKTR